MPSADPRSGLDPALAGRLKRNEAGLVAVVTQDATSGEVLMQAWMNDEALAATLATRRATYWSRSRDELWVKGLTSGHTQVVREVRLDCDGDTVLLKVDQTGAACHTGDRTCFDSDLLLADPLLADPSPATHVHHLSDQQAMERP
ncbi:phosphoribosyl-AMP cyclohydrolase [Aestuariimicrobium kwangyangense]|uniref:phosphoribosyl-AMP cyclohydrolase n=1 Tax=Aestuariimicrobium kwangyangense TaxID=396389 RepID=UPI0003B3A63A